VNTWWRMQTRQIPGYMGQRQPFSVRRGAEDDGGRSEPEPGVRTEKSDFEWDEDRVKERRMWLLRKARNPSVDAILTGYAEAFEGAAKGP